MKFTTLNINLVEKMQADTVRAADELKKLIKKFRELDCDCKNPENKNCSLSVFEARKLFYDDCITKVDLMSKNGTPSNMQSLLEEIFGARDSINDDKQAAEYLRDRWMRPLQNK